MDLINHINENHYIDENILISYKKNYDIVENSGISVKLQNSESYQLLKLPPDSFYKLFGCYELGAGISLFCKNQNELNKNENLLIGWHTSLDNMKKYFYNFNLTNDFFLNLDICLSIKKLSEKIVYDMILSNIDLQKKIFNGIGLYSEPYTAHYFYQNNKIDTLTFIDFYLTTGSGRSHGDYTVVLKPKKAK